MLVVAEPNLKIAAKHVQKFLAFMRVRFTAAAAGLDAKKMRLHGRLAPSQKLHADTGSGFQNFTLVGTHEAWIFCGGFEKREDIRAIETRDAA